MQRGCHAFQGWLEKVPGGLTTHNPDGSMSAAIEEAKEAVERAVGFPGLVLKEKDMFDLAAFSLEHASKEDATRAADAAAAVVESEGEDADSDA